ncbi:MAG: flavodoxin family protein [archaeon]
MSNFTKKEIELFKNVQAKTKIEVKELSKHFFENKIRILGVSGSARSINDMSKENSTSEWLLEKCLNEAKKLGAETKLISLRDFEIKPCKACYSSTNAHCHYKCSCYPEGEFGDDMTNKLYDMVSWADVIVFATPVNNFKISSMMSLFLDRLISMDGSLSPADSKNPKNLELNKKHTDFIESTASNKTGSGYLRRFAGKIGGMIVSGHEEGASLVISQMYMTLSHYGFIFPPFSNMYAMSSVTQTTKNDKKIQETEFYANEAKLLAKNLFELSKALKKSKDYSWIYDGKSN